jgi:Zn-dependent protease with chaperone function
LVDKCFACSRSVYNEFEKVATPINNAFRSRGASQNNGGSLNFLGKWGAHEPRVQRWAPRPPHWRGLLPKCHFSEMRPRSRHVNKNIAPNLTPAQHLKMSGNISPAPDLVLSFGSAPVNAKNYQEPGTGTAMLFGVALAIFLLLILTVVTYGIALIALLISPIVEWTQARKTMARIRGSGLEVSPQQFPEIYACAQSFAQRMGMSELPDIFIVESSALNAAALRVGSRKVVILIDDIVDACLRSGDNRTLAFILAHEMAHHALGHTGYMHAHIVQAYKKLSRLDEFSCDQVANALVGDSTVSTRALVTLAVGPQLLPRVNLEAVYQQAAEVRANKLTKKAETKLSHPLILNRIARFCAS